MPTIRPQVLNHPGLQPPERKTVRTGWCGSPGGPWASSPRLLDALRTRPTKAALQSRRASVTPWLIAAPLAPVEVTAPNGQKTSVLAIRVFETSELGLAWFVHSVGASTKRLPGSMRWLWWMGFGVLALAACSVVLRWMTLRRGHAGDRADSPAPSNPNACCSRSLETPWPTCPSRGLTGRGSRTGCSVPRSATCPWSGWRFRTIAAERAQFGKQLEEMLKVDNAIREAKDGDRNLPL